MTNKKLDGFIKELQEAKSDLEGALDNLEKEFQGGTPDQVIQAKYNLSQEGKRFDLILRKMIAWLNN